MDGWLAEKVQTQLGILVVPVEQRVVDRVGLARPRLRPHRPPGLPRVPEHPRRDEEPQFGGESWLRLSVVGTCDYWICKTVV